MRMQILKNIYFYKKTYKKNIKISKKHVIYAFLILFFIVFIFFNFMPSVLAGSQNEELERELTESVNEQLENINLDGLENILSNLAHTQQEIFNGNSVLEKLKELLTSEQGLEFENVFSSIINVLFDEIFNIIPILATICAIAVLSNLVGNLRTKNNEKSIGDLIHFVCYGIIIILVAGTLLAFFDMTKHTIQSLQTQMQVIFPILLTLMTAIGGTVSVGIYQPAMAILTSTVVGLFINIVLPIFICSFVFNVVGNLSNGIKLDKFSNFFSSAFKWIVGVIFTLFTTFITFQGISAGSYDGLSIKSAKYAIKNYVPFVGGYLSDGFNIIMSSSILIKNALGVVGLILLCATIIIPVIKIVLFGLGLKLASAIIEPVSDKRISNFVFSVGKLTNYLVAIILSISFMYLITIGLVMCTSNLIV